MNHSLRQMQKAPAWVGSATGKHLHPGLFTFPGGNVPMSRKGGIRIVFCLFPPLDGVFAGSVGLAAGGNLS